MASLLSPVSHGRILQMHDDKKSTREIAAAMNVSQSSVQRFITKYKETNSTNRRPGQGRKRVTTEGDDRAILREAKRNRYISAREIKENTGLRLISDRTITNRLTASQVFQSYWASRKPFISEDNRKKRVIWARGHIRWSREQWERVLWSDESPFVLRFNKRRRVWRMANERYLPEATRGTIKQDTKVMVWGCFTVHGVGALYRVMGTMYKEDYHKILVHQMRPSARTLSGR